MGQTSIQLDPQTNIIVTGIPRSGTTLLTALLNNLDNTLCLREPDDHVQWLRQTNTATEYTDKIIEDFKNIRKNISASKPVLDRVSEKGDLLTNYFPKRKDIHDRRDTSFAISNINISHLTDDFTLATKHNVEYTSVLPELVKSQQFTILCPIRNPISTILSWNTLLTPVSKGLIPIAKHCWPEVENQLASIDDLLARQVKIFDLFCQRYYQFREQITIIPYERLLEDQGIVYKIIGRKQRSQIELHNMNKSRQYDWSLAPKIYSLIRSSAKYIQYFYSESDLQNQGFMK